MPKIAGEIRRFLRDDGAVKVSRGMKERGVLVRGLRSRLCAELGREPALSELAEAAGLTPVTLPAQLQRVVMSIIYDEIKKGETGSREKFGEIDAYLRQAGCDCAILGCTELSVYRSLHSLPPYYIDAMEILAEQAILRCGKALRNV